jgi:hypothetical protein
VSGSEKAGGILIASISKNLFLVSKPQLGNIIYICISKLGLGDENNETNVRTNVSIHSNKWYIFFFR